ncbi:DUF3187 family protein [bacterium]|nr:MAG: DUF3187 family protein [bacterium]
MKTAGNVLLLVVFLLVFSSSSLYSFEGPLQVKNLYPIFLHANQPYIEKASMENSFSASLSHSSTYTVRQSDDWVINLDMEITELNLRYKRIINNFIEFNFDVPILIFGGGFLDDFLDGYHNMFGLPDYGRSERPLNSFLYEVRHNDKIVVKGNSGTGLGDLRLTFKKPLFSGSKYAFSLKGDVELPTGSAEEGFGNGSIDAAVSLLTDIVLSDNIMTYWNAGAVFPGPVRGHGKVDLKSFIYGGASIEALFRDRFSIIAQLYGQSDLYPETNITAVDRTAYLLAIGGRYHTERSSFELSLTEDINTAGAPDFIVNLTYKVKL